MRGIKARMEGNGKKKRIRREEVGMGKENTKGDMK